MIHRSAPLRVCFVVVLLGLVLIVAASALYASGPTFWTIASGSEFLKGRSDGVFVSLNGTITAGPQLTSRLGSAPAQIWSLAEGADGTLWAGTGGDGRVIRLRPGQPEETVFDAPEANVFALAISGTHVFAATGPDGKVYEIDGDTARPFFDPAEKYIWALAVDSSGRLWVGAGNPAVIYRVDPDGTSHVVYRPPAAHVVALVRDAEGRMLAGTESPGRLYRFSSDDRPFVVLDSGLTELGAISVDATGAVYAAAVARGDESSSGGETTSVAVTLASSSSSTTGSAASASDAATASAGSSSTTSSSARRSVLYRIAPDGTWEDIWATSDLIYDIAAQPDGVLVATGPEGRLYKVDQSRDVLLLTGVDAKQITRFASGTRPSGVTAFATANPGRVVLVGTGQQLPATYLSPVRDTRSVSSWGLIRWAASGAVDLYTRSGNTDRPDDSWSDWSGPYTNRDGQMIMSPPARFLQWRAVFTRPADGARTAGANGSSAVAVAGPASTGAAGAAGARPSAGPAATQLTSVTIAYLARNSRPVISSITVYPPGVVFQRPYSTDDSAIAGLDDATAESRRPPGDSGPTPATPTKRMFQHGLQTITWKADDDDNDHLAYTLEYRREGEQTWRELRRDLTDDIFVWDTTAVSDGRYIVRVRASDAPSNAADRALTGDRESDPIEVDNTPPTLTTELARNGTALRLIIRVHDARSPIEKVEYSVAGGPWQLLYPTDGLADSPDERYEIPLAADTDATRIVIRATDILQNVMSQPVAGKP
jgi:hypothetical protein